MTSSATPQPDTILDDLFHWAAWEAFIAEARAVQGWPDPEKTRRRCYALYEAEKRKEPQMATQPDDYDEDRRLVRLGIDPDGNPVEIMRQVDAKLKAMKKPSEEPPTGDAKPDVDRGKEPR